MEKREFPAFLFYDVRVSKTLDQNNVIRIIYIERNEPLFN